MIVAAASTYFALYVHVRQEVHLDAPLTFPLTCLATPSWNVEGEAPRFVTALA